MSTTKQDNKQHEPPKRARTKGENKMRNIDEISAIIANMDDVLFDRICKAENDVWSLDTRISRNGRRRLAYNLAKAGLTENEWYAWEAL